MINEILDKVYNIVKESPHSGQSLSLFALLKTLDIQKGGHMYTLEKLKDMTPENRQLAYGMIELMADNQTQSEEWKIKLELIETEIRANS